MFSDMFKSNVNISRIMSLLAKLLLTLLFGLLVSCEKKDYVIVDTTPPPNNVNNDAFETDLDLGWKLEREGQAYIFSDKENLRQITIAVIYPTDAAKNVPIEELGRAAIKIRQDTIRELSNGKATFTDVKSVKVPNGYDLSFSATDKVNEMKVRCTAFDRAQRIVTVTFLRYSPFPPDDELDLEFAELLTHIKVKD